MAARYNIAKGIFKIIGWFVGIVFMLLLGLHLWFVYHAEKVIEDLITWQSHGKLKATIKKFRIDYFNNKTEIKELTIFNTDALKEGTSYRFSTKELRFNILSKWDLLFHKQLLVDSVIFTSPDIIVTRRVVPQIDTATKKLLLAEELGNVYKTINTALIVLDLKRFEINEGRVIIKDADKLDKEPIKISHIYFSIDKLGVDSVKANKTNSLFYSNRVLLRILGQAIMLPDNKSNISFGEIMIDSKSGLIQILNPAINLVPAIGKKNNFIASAGKLNITGLDFNILYRQPLIKIDSVYMDNPQGDLQVYANGTNKNINNIDEKKDRPLDSILRHLPVAIDINHVVVQSGTFAMHLHQTNKTTFFETKDDNLGITGIRINDTAAKVLNIAGFNYTVRNYIGYTSDSVYRYRFDSLQFVDNRIVLYNFSVVNTKKMQGNLVRNYIVPRFEITGMDWLSFVFYNHFNAKKAVLFNPVFNIERDSTLDSKRTAGEKVDKKSFYQTLSIMDDLLDLDQLKIINGEFTLTQGTAYNLHFKKLNWDINANELTEAKTFKQLIHSVKSFSFDTATATNPTINLHVGKSNFDTKNKTLLLKNVLVITNNKNITADLHNVAVNDFSFSNNELEVNGIHWQDGKINIIEHNKAVENVKAINKTPTFILNNISANNTAISFENEQVKADIFLNSLAATSLDKSFDNPFQLKGFSIEGENANLNLANLKLHCNQLVLKDEQKSVFKNISFTKIINNDTVSINTPLVSFVPYLNKTMQANAIVMDSVEIQSPDIFIISNEKTKPSLQSQPFVLPNINVNNMAVNNASLHLQSSIGKDRFNTDLKQFSFALQNVMTQSDGTLLLNKIKLNATAFSFNKNDSIFIKSNATINAELDNVLFNTSTQNWRMKLDKLLVDEIAYNKVVSNKNKSQLSIHAIDVQNATATNVDFEKPLLWLINKSTATVGIGFVNWQTNAIDIQMNNFLLNGNKKHIDIDSIAINPAQNKEDFISNLTYRKSFIKAGIGKVAIDGIGIDNDFFKITHLTTNNSQLNIYSDKLIPKNPDKDGLQPLPVNALKKIGIALQIDTLQLNDMSVYYAELNAKTKQVGNISFIGITGNLFNVITRPLPTVDSLHMNVYAKFMDKIKLQVLLDESYLDSLNGFNLKLRVGGGDAKVLNAFLQPLVSIRARSGFVDTMSMTAYGNEKLAHGDMQLYYHDLKADLLDSGNVDHKKYKTKFYSFLANEFIRNNNYNRNANFSFVRNPQKSTIDYFIKMIYQGAAGNLMPSVSKMLFKKEAKKNQETISAQTNKQL